MAKILGTAGSAPKARRVNKTPPRKTVPIGKVPGSWAHPVHTSFTPKPPRPRYSPAIRKASVKLGVTLTPQDAQRVAQRHAHNAQARAVHRAARMDALHQLGLGPARTIRSVGFGQSPTMLIGDQRRLSTIRDSGVANNTGPRYSPQQIQHALSTVLQRGHSLQAQHAAEILHQSGLSDPFGSMTRHEQGVAHAAQHEQVVKQFLKRYKQLSKLNYGLGNGTLSDTEVRRRIAGATSAQLIHAMRTYQPSSLALSAKRVQTEGLSFDPRSLVDALTTGLSAVGEGINAVAGDSVVGNTISDAAFLPIGAVGAIATGVAHPVDTVKSLANGAIGHAVSGDFKGALKQAHDHPLFTLLELQGAKAALGRGIGAGLRATGRGELRRDPVALIGENGTRAIYERAYSKDAFNQAAQRAFDRRLPQGPHVELRGKQVPSRVMQSTRGGKVGEHVAGKVQGHLVNRFVDVFVSRVNSLSRQQREVNARYAREHAPTRQHGGKDARNLEARLHAGVVARREFAQMALRLPDAQRASALAALHLMDRHLQGLADSLDGLRGGRTARARQRVGEAVDRSLPSQPLTKTGQRVAARFPGLYRPERDVVSHSLQGLIRNNPEIRSVETLKEDLVAEQQRLMETAADPANTRREMALQQAQLIQRVLDSPKALANAEGIFRSQAWNAHRLNEQERNNIRLGLAAGAADRAKLFPFAQSRMGAQYGPGVKEHAQANAASARSTLRQVQRDVGKEMAALKERERYLMGLRDGTVKETQRVVANGRVVRYGPHFRADEVRRELDQVRQRITDLREARPARLRKARQEANAATRQAGSIGDQLHHADGTPLSNAEIRQAMRDHGVDPAQVAYLAHRENQMGPSHDRGAYYKRLGDSRENVAGSQKRTGELFRQGATAYDYNTIVDQMVRHGTKAINAQQLDKLVHDIGIRNPDGTYLTRAEFDKVQRRMRAAGTPVVPIVGHQQRLAAETRTAIHEGQDPIVASHSGGMLGEMHTAMSNAGAASARRNIVAVPEAFMNRLKAHLDVNGDPLGGRAFSSAFRKTVLPFSTKWMVGNVAEGVLRAIGTAGSIPVWDNVIAHRALANILREDARASGGADGLAAVKRWEDATNRAGRRAAMRDVGRHAPNAQAAKAELLGLLFYGNKGLTAKAKVGSGTLADHPAVHALSKTVDGLTAPSFALNRRLEHALQTMVLGKHMRQQIQEFTGSWIKSITAQKQALEDASKGLLDTSGQVRAAKMMDDVLGRYSRFSPKVRAAVQTAAPFLPWYLNSLRYTLVTLPLHNPIKTAVLTSVERQFQQDWQDQHKDIKNPGELNTAIRLRNGGFLDLARFTPFSFTGSVAAGDYGQIVSPLLPQLQGIEKAFNNQDPFGQPLQTRGADGKMRPLTKAEQRAYIANTAAEETVPLLAIIRRIMEGGATGLPTSTIFGTHTKPGSAHGRTGLLSGFNRALNPIRPIFLRNPAATRGSGKPVSVIDEGRKALQGAGGVDKATLNEGLKALRGG